MLVKFSALVVTLLLMAELSSAQRKLPNFSFEPHTTEFANANRKYNAENEFIDTLKDEHIITMLFKILRDNPELQVQIIGHTALNEKSRLGELRANLVYNRMVRLGIKKERMKTENFGHTSPILSDDVTLSLPTVVEKEAANQKNRRVEVKVVDLVDE
ncbi:MAG: hypothetical protein HN542_03740 [Flavobacteriales bacterium]|jgi:hypothetical protein|nr:hypothetical protein [Flavobacteriales bacterium]NCG29873.1 hypothetical protein [Bacteroidota bacterium]MBT4705121.1 hypothetical protein [Flavobacteriales bacterium]MBT4930141.1 hypothetical protein [Flavobacteriales bacterium]MBT5133099.1 hypothetical protein [Flavobacteriales bacterium]